MNRLLIAISAILVSSNCVNGQYFEWPNAFNNFQQQQQFQYNYQPRAQYQPVQYQQQQQQPQQQFYQQQQQPQQQLYQSQPQYQPPQGPSPIYSQTVIIPEAPPPPPEAYQTQQYQPAQSAPVLVSPAQYNVQQPAIAAAPSSSSSSSSSQQLQRFEQRARSVPNFEVNNKLFREQPMAFQQNQEKIELLAQPPPPPSPSPPAPAPIRVPPPPSRFVPSLKSLTSLESQTPKPIENPEYHPDQVIVDRHRTAYFEDTQRTRPQQPKQRVQGGNVNAVFHSSSANIPSRASPQPPPPQPGRSVAVIASPSQQQQRPPQVKPQPQRPPVAPQPPRRVVRPTVRPASASRPSSSVVTRPRPPVVRTRPASNAVVPQTPTRQLAKVATAAPPPVSHLVAAKPKTASEKFLQCCKARNVDKSCERICSFDVLSKKTLTGMFLGTDPCPQKHGADLMQCAADNDDHTQCCIDYEVDRTSAGKKCLGFCNMKPGVTFQADVSMLPCWAVLNDIKKCFKENLDQQLAAAAVIA